MFCIAHQLIVHFSVCPVLAQKTKHNTSYVWESWQRCERELTRERGLWGPMKGSHLDKWILDATEGPCRMRKKMVHNRLFYKHYPYKQHIENPECVSLLMGTAGSSMASVLHSLGQCEEEADLVL